MECTFYAKSHFPWLRVTNAFILVLFCFVLFSSSNDVCSTFLIFGTRNVALLAPFSNPTSLQLVLSVVRLELKILSLDQIVFFSHGRKFKRWCILSRNL